MWLDLDLNDDDDDDDDNNNNNDNNKIGHTPACCTNCNGIANMFETIVFVRSVPQAGGTAMAMVMSPYYVPNRVVLTPGDKQVAGIRMKQVAGNGIRLMHMHRQGLINSGSK
jgi:hypothetical protein